MKLHTAFRHVIILFLLIKMPRQTIFNSKSVKKPPLSVLKIHLFLYLSVLRRKSLAFALTKSKHSYLSWFPVGSGSAQLAGAQECRQGSLHPGNIQSFNNASKQLKYVLRLANTNWMFFDPENGLYSVEEMPFIKALFSSLFEILLVWVPFGNIPCTWHSL